MCTVRSRSGLGIILWRLSALLIVALSVGLAYGDVIRTQTGETFEGEILEDLGESYRIRTLNGIADIEKQRIAGIEKKPSPWRLYAARRKKTPNTAESHYRLALWCEGRGLRGERTDELEKVIQLEPDHAAARKTLGYVQNSQGRWEKRASAKPPISASSRRSRLQQEEEKLVRKLITEWFVKVKAIYRGRMAGEKRGGRSKRFRQARRTLLAIRDPLALPALTGILSTGSVPVRRVLVEALTQFDVDEATMNLLVISLLDPSRSIRRLASIQLAVRDDDRVIARLKDALKSDEEGVLRNAATALGILKAGSAVDDLIEVLTAQSRQRVRVSRPVYLGDVLSTFGGFRRVANGRRLIRYQPISIGVLDADTMVGTHTYREMQTVVNYRTEVQEALIAITGQNFGFDADEWHDWWHLNGQR